ncbi:homocysteine S-methyltransferase family protein [Streptomyces sp. NPDC004787]|uniref:homocysteine S-methyltransferase family protein n=1 Tax=Streptomyces sp. NPDC004787 TaxID=3154291 RepID=UPI00339EB352
MESGRKIEILDGGIATSLQKAGIRIDEPWLSAAALRDAMGMAALIDIHAQFLEAGSGIIGANTFRTNARTLSRIGVAAKEHATFVHRAIDCAVQARHVTGMPQAMVAATVAPVEDCYSPELTPDIDTLRREHRWMASILADSPADIVLVETQCTQREAVIATESAREYGLTPWVSFVVSSRASLIDGSDLRQAAHACAEAGAAALSVNCVHHTAVPRAIEQLADLGLPIGVYPNLEDRTALGDWEHSATALPSAISAERFGSLVRQWVKDYPLAFAGGCCGATPAHIRAMAEAIGSGGSAPSSRSGSLDTLRRPIP